MTAPSVARIKAARRLGKRAFRDREGRFLAEGPQAVREALAHTGASGEPTVVEVFATLPAAARHADLLHVARVAGVSVQQVSGEDMAALCQTVTPQGIVAVCRQIRVDLAQALETPLRLVVVLAFVRDPGNAGTVVRVADAAGADAVVFSSACVDPYNGKVVRASVGSLFHQPVVVNADLAPTLDALRARGLQVLAADGSGDVDLDRAERSGGLDAPTAWLFGNEAWGLPDEVLALADTVVRIPIYGRAESLNLATAAALCLYASARQHSLP
jgi:RNA methyltransferase, TrmH family